MNIFFEPQEPFAIQVREEEIHYFSSREWQEQPIYTIDMSKHIPVIYHFKVLRRFLLGVDKFNQAYGWKAIRRSFKCWKATLETYLWQRKNQSRRQFIDDILTIEKHASISKEQRETFLAGREKLHKTGQSAYEAFPKGDNDFRIWSVSLGGHCTNEIRVSDDTPE